MHNRAPKVDHRPIGRKDAPQIPLAIPTHLQLEVVAVATGTKPQHHCHNLNLKLSIQEVRLVLLHHLVVQELECHTELEQEQV